MNIVQLIDAPSGLVAVFEEDENQQEYREPIVAIALVETGFGREPRFISVDPETGTTQLVNRCRIEHN